MLEESFNLREGWVSDIEEPAWIQAMFTELDNKSTVDQITSAGYWITLMTHDLLTRLADRRRKAIVKALSEGYDAIRLAETVGMRANQVRRLRDEGRVALGGVEGVHAFVLEEAEKRSKGFVEDPS